MATQSGISKRMIHYHFTDKKGLYIAALRLAVTQLRPNQEELELESVVPVESAKKIVSVVFDHFEEHPDAVKLVLTESVYHHVDAEELPSLADHSDLFLQLNKLLMLGQDAGAFRPGISALDMYASIVGMCLLPYSWNLVFRNLYDTDLSSSVNTKALRDQAQDQVISFLTAQLPPTGGETYLQPERNEVRDSGSVEGSLYSAEEGFGNVYE
ncbi:MAG: TetR/AcrR family transcriptional regulator [Corynebacterium glucuronolyticum]|nr:TetR/AcrR family transcriptional regulator [Corynebacterium glucuronolyticum]